MLTNTIVVIAIRYFVVNVIVQQASDDANLVKQRTYINKLNMTLVQVTLNECKKDTSLLTHIKKILKQEWPHNWPTFISEIVSSSETNLALCENNMSIFKLLRFVKHLHQQ